MIGAGFCLFLETIFHTWVLKDPQCELSHLAHSENWNGLINVVNVVGGAEGQQVIGGSSKDVF